jgi:hypothetical protein
MILHTLRLLGLMVLATLQSSCGNGSGDSMATSGFAERSATRFQMESDVGDPIGKGLAYDYSLANALIKFQSTSSTKGGATRQGIRVDIDSAEVWSASFVLPADLKRIQPGRYEVGAVYPDNGNSAAANISRHGTFGFIRQCTRTVPNPTAEDLLMQTMGRSERLGASIGWFAIDNVIFQGDEIAFLSLRFELRCESQDGRSSMRGLLQYRADDATTLAGPSSPPVGLWSPSGTAPVGNYVRFESEAGDPVGLGQVTTLQASGDFGFAVSGSSSAPEVSIFAASLAGSWSATFRGMGSLERLQPGYYGNVRSAQTHYSDRRVSPLIRVGGPGGVCSTDDYLFDLPIRGWFVIDSISYVDGQLKSLDMRFEQRCEGASGVLRGQVHWVDP